MILGWPPRQHRHEGAYYFHACNARINHWIYGSGESTGNTAVLVGNSHRSSHRPCYVMQHFRVFSFQELGSGFLVGSSGGFSPTNWFVDYNWFFLFFFSYSFGQNLCLKNLHEPQVCGYSWKRLPAVLPHCSWENRFQLPDVCNPVYYLRVVHGKRLPVSMSGARWKGLFIEWLCNNPPVMGGY